MVQELNKQDKEVTTLYVQLHDAERDALSSEQISRVQPSVLVPQKLCDPRIHAWHSSAGLCGSASSDRRRMMLAGCNKQPLTW
jgi:hypothetical protein